MLGAGWVVAGCIFGGAHGRLRVDCKPTEPSLDEPDFHTWQPEPIHLPGYRAIELEHSS